MKLILCFVLVLSCSSWAVGQRRTPTNVYVPVEIYTELSAPDIAAGNAKYDSIVQAEGWNAERIGPCSNRYNCHGYTWHLSDEGDSVNIESVTAPSLYFSGTNASYEQVIAGKNYRKVYYDGVNHSGITDSLNPETMVISKWGNAPLYRHALLDCPYPDLGSYTIKYYEIKMDGTENIAKGCATNITTLNISNATYTWTAVNNYVCVSGNTYLGSVTGIAETPTYGKGEVKVEIASPYSNTTIKGIKEFEIGPQPTTLPYVTGPTLVCSSGGSLTLNNVPAGNAITWSSSSNLSTTNNTANPCTFTSTGNGSGWVKASLSTPCANNIFADIQYNVWSGKPVFTSFSGPLTTPNNQWATYYALPNNSLMAVTDYNWNLNPLNGNSLYDYGQSVDIAFYNPGSYQLVVQGKNTCSSPNFGPFYVGGIYVYDSYMMSISPNPTSGISTLTIESTSTKKTTDENVEWELEIFSETQIVIEKKTKLKGVKYEINLTGWREGVYFVRVKYKNEILQGKLIVKK